MGHDLGYAALALLATSTYYVAFVVFRTAARRMPPLRGSRPFHVAWTMLTDPVWFGGGLLLFAGLAGEVVAFEALPLAVAQPVFAVSLVLLVIYAVWVLGERMTGREWTSVALFVVATVLVGLSAGEGSTAVADTGWRNTLANPWPVVGVTLPALLIAVLVWLVGDRRAGGRHAKRLAGVAYGIGAGACAGLAEAGIRGMALVFEQSHRDVVAVLNTPYPYLTLGLAALALGQLQVALQRCRLAIIATVLTVIGRSYLVLASTVLYHEGWPSSPGPFALRTGGLILALIALLNFPRYERRDVTGRRTGRKNVRQLQ
ncbi:DMT family transporter [Actinomadura rupiterrae]|uniref:DMT family transporter n=1 Tax=Actinomadura rupiterrae TaxID=559627 RepID=UPI0020A26A78|nr:DMT family transporter [Actinomadura rupiterrae]MCP2336356.1 drug/metabolite transporter (DMT)-like permease [Actinomadura rupiterrae]